MNRKYALMVALGAGLFAVGCDEAADRGRDLLREQQSKVIQGATDAARSELDKTRKSAGDAISGEKKDDEANELKGGDEK